MAGENTTNSATRPMMKKISGANRLLIGLIIVLVAAIGYLYTQYSALKADPTKEAQAEVDRLVSQVSKLIVLPTDEQPTVATVSDIEKLKDQPFFAKAQNGNKVLIYTGAKKAILFDPVANKIIEVAPINIGDSTKTKQTAPKPAPAPVQVQATESTTTDTSTGN